MALSIVMNEVLRGINWKYALVYTDNIIIFSSFEEHLLHLGSVFTRVIQAKFKLQPAKCLFAMPKVPYLGHINDKGTATDPDKKLWKHFLFQNKD